MNMPKFLSSIDNFLAITGVSSGEGSAQHYQQEPAPVSSAPYMQNDISDLVLSRTDKEMNELPYGAFELDAGGAVLRYNDAEAAMSGQNPAMVIGRNFFTEIAPCTRRPEFLGRFLDGVRLGKLDALFEMEFEFKNGRTKVWVNMKTAPHGKSHWVFIKRM